MTTYIYALHCPIAKTVRYIGKSVNPSERFEQHLYFAKTNRSNHHTARWLRKLLSQGLLPTLDAFYEIKEGEDWREVERFWISEAESFGWKLTNTTAGGDGVEITCPKALVAWKKAVKERWQDPVLRESNSQKLKAYYSTPEGKANKLRTSASAAKLEASRQSQMALWKTPEYRERQTALIASPILVKEASERSTKLWADPEFKAKRASLAAERKALRAIAPIDPQVLADRAARRAEVEKRSREKRREQARAFAASPEGMAKAEASRVAQRARFVAMTAATTARREAARRARIAEKNSPEAIGAREAKKLATRHAKNDRRNAANRAKKEAAGLKVRRSPYPPEVREEMNKERKRLQRAAKRQAEKQAKLAETNS